MTAGNDPQKEVAVDMDIQITVTYRNAAPSAALLQGWAAPVSEHVTRLWSVDAATVDGFKHTSDPRFRLRTPPA